MRRRSDVYRDLLALPKDIQHAIADKHATCFLIDKAESIARCLVIPRCISVFGLGNYAIVASRARVRTLTAVYLSWHQQPRWHCSRRLQFDPDADWHEVATTKPARYVVMLVRAQGQHWQPVRAYSFYCDSRRIHDVRNRLDLAVSWVLRSGRVHGPYRGPKEQPVAFHQWSTDDLKFRR